jgi:hypothetical protein
MKHCIHENAESVCGMSGTHLAPAYRPGLYGYLLDNGHVFYSGKVMEDLDRFAA